MKSVLILILTICFAGCSPKQAPSLQKVEMENWCLWTAAWSPDDQLIAVGGAQDTLRLFEKPEAERHNYFFEGTITSIKWHPAKKVLAIAIQGEKSGSSIFNLYTAERMKLDSICVFGARAIGWNHTGEMLAVGDYDGSLVIYDEQGQFIRKIATGQKGIIGLDWHPSKNQIVAVGESISLYDFNSKALHHMQDRAEDVLMLSVAWHPDGELFVTGDYGDYEKNYLALLQFWTATGERIRQIEQSKAEYRNLKWSNDGANLATASDAIRLWSVNGNLIAEKTTENLLWGIDWNNAGTNIITTDEKGKIVIWDKALNKMAVLKY